MAGAAAQTHPAAAGPVSHRRWAEVCVDALAYNCTQVRGLLRPGTELLAMVKSNGYGHGLLLAAEGAVRGGASWLGVYHAGEAFALREAGHTLPILIVGPTAPVMMQRAVEADVDLTLSDPAEIPALVSAARGCGRTGRVHLKIDTGLNRIGVSHERAAELSASLHAAGGALKIAGIFTHFADADAQDLGFAHEQHRRFLEAAGQLREAAADALLHAAGSAAILRLPEAHHDLVRLGIAMYGYPPPHTQAPPLRLAMTVLGAVVQVKTVAAGDTVGYGRTWTAPRASRIATVSIGYGQGVRRDLSGRGHVAIRASRCPIVGTISMDQLTVDVSDVEGVAVGDEAMILGTQGDVRIGADEVAAIIGTIPHELICAVPSDMPRVVVGR